MRASFSLVIALGLLLYGAIMPPAGALVDRIGARAVALVRRQARDRGCTILVAAAGVSLRIDDGARQIRWLTRTASA